VLLTGGLAVALALVPAAALAEEPPSDPTGGLGSTLEEGAAQLTEGRQQGEDGAEAPTAGDRPTTLPGQEGTAGGGSTTEEPTAESAFEGLTPDELDALLAELEAAGVPLACVEDVAAGVEEIVLGLQETLDPARFEQLLTDLEAGLLALQEGGRPELPPALTDSPLAADLEALAASLEECLAAGSPTGEEPPAPAEQPEPAVLEAPAAAPHPVSYPGYAPTGTEAADETSATAPLAALGAGLLLVGGAGVAGSWTRTRAARDEG
jgi:hypothetical protein